MNAFAKVDKETFLRFAAEHTEERYEFVRGRIVQQMIGGTRNHGRLSMRIATMIIAQLSERDWTIITDRGVETPETIRYPDVVVEPADEPGDSLATARAALIVEVLSPSTTNTDLDVKPDEYFSIPSLDAYIVASQTEAACLLWLRGPDGRISPPQEIRGPDTLISIKGRAFAVELPLAEIYRGIA